MSAKEGPTWTKGPYKALRAVKSSNFGGYVARVMGPNSASIARVYAGNSTDRVVSDANANLLSAAPELYEALAGLVWCNERWNESAASVIGRPPEWNDSYLNLARAALAKARGEK